MSNQKLSNEEFLDELMRFSKYGALTQVFVMEAIRFYAEEVSRTTFSDDKNTIINPETWHAIAVDLKKAFEERYS